MQISNYTDAILINSLNRCNNSINKSQSGLAKMSSIDGFKNIGSIINNIRMPRTESEARGIQQGNKNIQDGVSLIQTSENSLDSIQSMGQRLRELATQYNNGTLNDEDKKQIENEAKEYYKEIGKTIDNTKFNNIKVFDKNEYYIQTGAYSGDGYTIKLDGIGRKLSDICNKVNDSSNANSQNPVNPTNHVNPSPDSSTQNLKYVNISQDGKEYYTGWIDNKGTQQKYGVVYNNQTGLVRYEGEIEDGSANGQGIRYYDSGALKYKGDFKDGLYNGYGEKFEEAGYLSYRGKFVNGERNGEGISFDKNGDIQAEGIWKDGKLIESKTVSMSTSSNTQINLDFTKLKNDNITQVNVTNNSMIPNDEAIFKASTTTSSNLNNTSSSEEGIKQKYGVINDKSTGMVKYDGDFKDGVYSGKGESYAESKYLAYRGGFENGKRNEGGIGFEVCGNIANIFSWKAGIHVQTKPIAENTSNQSQTSPDFTNLKNDTSQPIETSHGGSSSTTTSNNSNDTSSSISQTSTVKTITATNQSLQYINITQDGKTYYTGWVDEQGIRQKYGTVHDKSTGMVKYDGGISNGFANGQGVKYYNTGMVQYKGDFKDGVYSGKGESYAESGYLAYRGGFENGKRNGEGIEFDVCGNIANIGVWKDDILVQTKPIAENTSNQSQISLDFTNLKNDTATQYNVNKDLISTNDTVFKTSSMDATQPTVIPIVISHGGSSSTTTESSNSTSTTQTTTATTNPNNSSNNTTSNKNMPSTNSIIPNNSANINQSTKEDVFDVSKWLNVDFIDNNILKPIKSVSYSLKVQEDILGRRTSLNDGKIEVLSNDVTNKTTNQYQEMMEKLAKDTQSAQIVSAMYQQTLSQRRESIVQLLSAL